MAYGQWETDKSEPCAFVFCQIGKRKEEKDSTGALMLMLELVDPTAGMLLPLKTAVSGHD